MSAHSIEYEELNKHRAKCQGVQVFSVENIRKIEDLDDDDEIDDFLVELFGELDDD